MARRADFLHQIHIDPDSDVPRLLYADWLEEHGAVDYAEFIRLQLLLANTSENLPQHKSWWKRVRLLEPRVRRSWLPNFSFQNHLHFQRGLVEALHIYGWSSQAVLQALQEALADQDLAAGLRQLRFERCNLNEPILALCSKFVRLQSLDLNGCHPLDTFHLAYLGNLTQLRSLNLTRCTNLRDADLNLVTKLAQLRALDLSDCIFLTDVGFSQLGNLTQLRSLQLAHCNKLTNTCLAYLNGLPELQFLNLAGCTQLTDIGIGRLAKMLRLQSLNLSGCVNLTDSGLLKLNKLAELRDLYIYNCDKLTMNGMNSLREALPNLVIHG